ncbi:hypothetical protein BDV33DRAFT_183117 [Aspergillus novoparasiticus]|uniref:Uncharacterized protein n=1 Tax=Aspergillus novoparasiticus TaxID=986946 RepID=A0A5N6EA71_9EURO|nr:hypothetical protein BDV33DRAFT_183117 [Aspergillus novoparasiticus]
MNFARYGYCVLYLRYAYQRNHPVTLPVPDRVAPWIGSGLFLLIGTGALQILSMF